MKFSRTKNIFRNTFWGIIYRTVTLLGPFLVKTLIIYKLGDEYNGLSSLFTSILTVLNLSNLGFSSSLVYMMYKAVAEDDTDTLCALLNFFRKAYKYVGLAILTMGIAIMPILPKLISGSYPADINLYILFAIYLLETSLGYLMFAYNTALFSAYQREDTIHKINTIRYFFQYTLQCLSLVIFANYYAYIVILPLMVIPNNIAIYIVAKKQYPKIKCKGKISTEDAKSLKKRVITLFGHKIGSTVLVSIDSMIISSFLGLITLSNYSNYYYILVAVNGIIEIFTNGSIASIGNKLITDTKESNYRTFMTMSYTWITIVGFSAAYMLTLYQPFIAIWVGSERLLSDGIMALIVIYFYSWMFRIMQLTYRDAAGLWTKDWLKPYVGMIINLIGSILMVKLTNSIVGVLIPTTFVFFAIYFPWEAKTIFKYEFNKSPNQYYKRIIIQTCIVLIGAGASYLACIFIYPSHNLLALPVRLFITTIIFGIIWWICTRNSEEYKGFTSLLSGILQRKRRV